MSGITPFGAARKRLPVKPSEEHLRKQAKRIAKERSVELAAAQHELAKEYGCKSWAELMHVVETMLRGADQFMHVKYEMEALPKAANAGDLEKVREILASGEFTQHDLDLALARSLFRYREKPELARLLVESGADVDGQYGSGYGPIVFGTGEGLAADALEFLLEKGADVTFEPVETKYGRQCALSYWLGTYVRGRNEEKHRGVELLLKHGAYVPAEVRPEVLAIHRGDAKGLGQMLDRDRGMVNGRYADMPYGNIELRGATLLHCAVEFGEVECAEELFKRYADINMKADVIDGVGGQTPVFHAIHSNGNGNFYMLEYLVKRVGQWMDMGVKATWRGSVGWAILGFDATKEAMTAREFVERAVRDLDPKQAHFYKRGREELELVEGLDRRGAVRRACERGDVEEVRRMVEETPGLLGPELWPGAIFVAKSLAMTRMLLDMGLNPNECSAPRKPLHLASDRGLVDVVRLLLERGARLDVVDGENITPYELMNTGLVSGPNKEEIRQMLRDAGARDTIFSLLNRGEEEGALEMLKRDPSLRDVVGPIFFTPLHTASRAGAVRVVRALLELGADVNDANPAHNSSLWLACQSDKNAENRVAVARMLIEAGADVNRRCEEGTTALHFAASRGPLEMVELLIRSGAKVSVEDLSGKKPVDHAREWGRGLDKDEIIRRLTEADSVSGTGGEREGADRLSAFLDAATPRPESQHSAGSLAAAEGMARETPRLAETSIFAAAVLGDEAAVRLHVGRDASLAVGRGGPRGWSPLLYLCFSRYLKERKDRAGEFARCATLLLKHGADANDFWTIPANPTFRETALYGAAGIANSAAVARVLLEAGARTDEKSDPETLYHVAEFTEDHACLELVLSSNPGAGWMGYCLLHKLDFDDLEGVMMFLRAKPDVGRVHPESGMNALHWAILRSRDVRFFRPLLEYGVSVLQRDKQGRTPYEYAMLRGRKDVAELLAKAGGASALTEKQRFLIACIDGDEADARGLATPEVLGSLTAGDRQLLPDAAADGKLAAVRLMLDLGFAIDEPGQWKGSAAHQAAWHGRVEVLRLLIERGANLQQENGFGGTVLGTAIYAGTNNAGEWKEEILPLVMAGMPREELAPYLDYARTLSNGRVVEMVEAEVSKRRGPGVT